MVEDQHNKHQQEMEGLLFRSIFDAVGDGLVICDVQTGKLIEVNPAACSMHGFQPPEMIGKAFTDFVEPSCRVDYLQFVERAQSNAWAEESFTLLRKDDTSFSTEIKGTLVEYSGKVCLLNTFHDISRWVLSEKKLQEQAEVHIREQSTLLEISQALASTLELKPGIVLDQLRAVIDFSRAIRFELDNRNLVSVSVHGSVDLGQSGPFIIDVSDPQIMKALFDDLHPIIIDDVWGDEPQSRLLRLVLNKSVTGFLDGIHAWMWVPISLKGRLLGGLGVVHSQKGFFSSHHADLAFTVANQAAIAMANSELYIHAQTLAVLQERQRLARELHDSVNQSLFSAGLIAEVLPRLWDINPEEARRSLEDLRRLTQGAQADMRLLLAELRPTALTDTNFTDLLRLLANAFTGRTNIPVEIKIEGESILPGDVQLTFYRLCQEEFNNIARHAGARTVKVHLHSENGTVDLIISDDGNGFDPDHIPPGHFGVSMMHERAETVGASLSIRSEPRKGTDIRIRWPDKSGKEGGKG